MISTMTDRQSIRTTMQSRRQALSADELQAAAHRACQRLTGLPVFRNSARIATYLAVNGELDPDPVVKSAWQHGKTIALPTLHDKHLEFLEYTADTLMQTNSFGIPEPDPEHASGIPTHSLDLVLVPLVAFDISGNRLGMGGGFYDRTFAFLRDREHASPTVLLGMAHEFQRVDALSAASWDIPLHGIITDTAWYPASPLLNP